MTNNSGGHKDNSNSNNGSNNNRDSSNSSSNNDNNSHSLVLPRDRTALSSWEIDAQVGDLPRSSQNERVGISLLHSREVLPARVVELGPT